MSEASPSTNTADKPLAQLADAEKNIPASSTSGNSGDSTESDETRDKRIAAEKKADADRKTKDDAERAKREAEDEQRAKDKQAEAEYQRAAGNQQAQSAPRRVGTTVLYALTDADVVAVDLRRALSPVYRNTPDTASTMHKAHEGSSPLAGIEYPMIVTSENDDGTVNGQVFLDGNDTLFVQSVDIE